MMAATIVEVQIVETARTGHTWVSRHRTDGNCDEALRRALHKHFGANASFFRNYELTHSAASGLDMFGQVVEPAKNNPGAYNCLTGTVRVHFEAQ